MRFLPRASLLLAAVSMVCSSCANAGSGAQPASSETTEPALQMALQRNLDDYLASRGKTEHISAVSLSVNRAGDANNVNVTAGTYVYGGSGGNVTPASLYQIGSVTKSFTSAAILHQEAAGKLTIDDTVGKWLPQYPAWKNITIRRLLNMTSGITTYDNELAFQKTYARDPTHDFPAQTLIAFVYPHTGQAATFQPGWYYSNTAYILSQLIAQRASGVGFDELLRNSLIGPQRLGDTFYESNMYPSDIRNRMVEGYFASKDPVNAGLSPLYGKSVRNFSVSWAQGAGGIVSTPQDVTHWVRALFDGPVLPPKQRAEMMSLVSLANGKPVAATSVADPRGFGLGVAQSTMPPLGTFWFYEGETLGYRMLYGYLPKTKTIIAIGLNSQPSSKEDHIGKLMETVYQTLSAHHAL